jgi:apolipoprotein N-acyltransferase
VAVASLSSAGSVLPLGTRLRAYPKLTAAAAGLLLVSALPPVHFVPGLFGFALLLHLLHGESSGTRSFVLAWLFSFTFFTGGLYWIAIAFFIDAERFGLLAVPAVLGLCALLAATAALGAWATALLRWRSLEARALAFAVAWTVGEMVRADTFIDFLWNPVAIVWTVTDATMQGVAWFGTYGLSLVTVVAAGMLARLLEPRHRLLGLGAMAGLSALLLALGTARLAGEAPAPTSIQLRLVQGNVPQDLKWDREKRIGWFRRHLELSAGAAEIEPDAVIWPESAVPFQIEADPAVRQYIAQVLAPGAHALVGGDRFVIEDDRIVAASNSLFALDAEARIVGRYDKVDLVPFGEFTPFRELFGRLGLGKLVENTADFTPGQGRVVLAPPGLPPFSPLICYEAVLPNEATPDGQRPAWILNITNDAWFGTSSGPYQHLAMARMRAVEEGLPLVRAANTGISVVTDAFGRVQARLGLNQMGVIDARLPGALQQASPERRLGAALLPALAGLALLISVTVEIYKRRHA